MTKIRLLLAEDHEMVRRGLRLLLDSQPDMETVGEAGDGREAVRLAGELRPDVIVMDVSMPVMNGIKATEAIRASYPDVRVLTLTRHADEVFLQQLARAGVSGYLLKQSAPSELTRAVRAVAAGEGYLDPALSGAALGSVGLSGRGGGGAVAALTDRETQVLRLIATGLANKEIAGRLGISVKTVEVHKANGMRKLGARSRTDLLRYAQTRGWLEDL